MQNIIYVGIDVSSSKLDIAYLLDGTWRCSVTANDWESCVSLAAELAKLPGTVHCVVEATGTYSRKVLLALHDSNLLSSQINPTESSSFAKMRNKTTKNDKSDAKLLAEYGTSNASYLKPYSPPTETQESRTQLLNAIGQLESQLQQTSNQLHAYAQLPPRRQLQSILSTYNNMITNIKGQIEKLRDELRELNGNDNDTQKELELMVTVKGIGEKTALEIVDKTGGMANFDNPKQLSKFAGIAPTERTSGTSVRGRRGINRAGNSSLRKALYCATWSAIAHNNACKSLYNRLKSKGKSSKVALIAVANLLLRQIFAVVTSNTPFDNNYDTSKLKN